MSKEEIKEKIRNAIRNFNKEKQYLYGIKIYEPTLSHRIALLLEKEFKGEGYVVDCEYNKNINLPKTNDEGEKIRPDIIVHKRNSKSDNLVVIEVKKGSKDTKLAEKDIKKLMKMNNLKYSTRLFFGITKKKIDLVWVDDSGIVGAEII